MDNGQGDIAPENGEWISLGETARRLGVSRAAVYGRIERGTLTTRPKGNRGLEVLWLPPQRHRDRKGDADITVMASAANVIPDSKGDVVALADSLRERLARAEGEAIQLRQYVADLRSERDQIMEQRAQVCERAAQAEGEAKALRDALADLATRLDATNAELRELRRPWLLRILEAIRQ
jgi:hypothetical protein